MTEKAIQNLRGLLSTIWPTLGKLTAAKLVQIRHALVEAKFTIPLEYAYGFLAVACEYDDEKLANLSGRIPKVMHLVRLVTQPQPQGGFTKPSQMAVRYMTAI